ncbi:hypothetical protein Tco_1165574 [Tanacetum coccineum]
MACVGGFKVVMAVGGGVTVAGGVIGGGVRAFTHAILSRHFIVHFNNPMRLSDVIIQRYDPHIGESCGVFAGNEGLAISHGNAAYIAQLKEKFIKGSKMPPEDEKYKVVNVSYNKTNAFSPQVEFRLLQLSIVTLELWSHFMGAVYIATTMRWNEPDGKGAPSFTPTNEFLYPKKKLEVESWIEDSKNVDPLISSDDDSKYEIEEVEEEEEEEEDDLERCDAFPTIEEKEMADQDTPPPTITAMKIPIIKKGEYDIWSMRMRQYICHTDHNLWDIIVNGDLEDEATPSGEQSSPPVPKTAKQLAARRNQERIKSILLLAIPDEYLLKFHNVPDAKSLWAAIRSRF